MSLILSTYRKANYANATLALLYIAVSLYALHDYMPWKSYNFLLGLLALPYMLVNGGNRQKSLRLGYWAIAAGILYLLVPMQFVLFLMLCGAMLCIWEYSYGKVSSLMLITILMMSPAFHYFVGVFSFPIRIELTEKAATLFNVLGVNARSLGNVITYNGSEYAVDPACVGLKMIVTSFLCGLITIAVVQKQKQKFLSLIGVAVTMVAIFLLNVVANFTRILLLVYFNILPENPMHETIGLICLIVYVLAPALWIIRLVVKKYGTVQGQTVMNVPTGQSFIAVHGSLVFLIFIVLFIVRTQATAHFKAVPVPGYKVSVYDRDIIKYTNSQSLVYIKRINSAFLGEHNPLFCWQGGGYVFDALQTQKINGVQVFSGLLKQDKDVLYTAWWYDNGQKQTISQLNWRWQMIKGKPAYSIVNVTAANKEQLYAEINSITRYHTFKEVYRSRD